MSRNALLRETMKTNTNAPSAWRMAMTVIGVAFGVREKPGAQDQRGGRSS